MPDHSIISSPSPTIGLAVAKGMMPIQESLLQEFNETLPLRMPLQFKLSVGAADDPLEHEADAMADTIMRMPEQNFIQRKCAHCEEEAKLQRKPLASFIQRKETSSAALASDAITNQINSSRGNGSNIDSPAQSFMETRFGADFSDVKIHTNHEAVQMNRELNAKAFTVGSDIYFNEGQYNPGSNDGKHLLAHELTHTIQQNGEYNSLMRYPCPTSSCHGDDGHEGFYKRLHPLPPEPIKPDPFPYPVIPGPTPVPIPPTPPTPVPVPKPPIPPEPVKPVIDEEKIVEEIRDKIFKKVVIARSEKIPFLPTRIPYPYKQDAYWRLNVMIGLKAEDSIILSPKEYVDEKDVYVESLFQLMRKKIETLEKKQKDKDDEDDTKDKPDHKDKKDKTDDKDCGRLGCTVDKVVDALEELDEFLGISDLADLPSKLRALPEYIDLFELMQEFWKFKDHLNEFEKWLKEPQVLLRALIGIEPSLLLDTLQDWVDSGNDKAVQVDKGEEIHSLAQRVRRLLAKIRSMLRPIFAIRKKMLRLVADIHGLVSQVPSLESIKYLLSIAGNPDELKEAGKELVEDTVGEFASDITYLIRLKIEEVVQTLRLPVLKFSGEDFINNGQIARAIAKVATRLVPGMAGKVLRTEPGKIIVSRLVELFLNGIESEVFDVINSKLGGFNKLLIKQFDGAFNIFETKMSDFIVPKINEKIFGKEIKISRSAADTQSVEDAGGLQMLPSLLQQSKGEQVNGQVLHKMESLIYPDFNDVRIHRGKEAEQAAHIIHAKAFTIGSDIYFGKGKYDPYIMDGQKLLAHELTHVAQQKNGNASGTIQRSLIDQFGEGVMDAISILPFEILPETGFKDPKTQKPLRQKDRRFLRKNMTGPVWADSSSYHNGWNAHHIIPWEFLHHGVFDVLRANGGWDFNDPRNGIALPLKTGIPGAEKLPVHQAKKILLRGHPVYNQKVKEKLDQLLESYETDPARLRQEVYKLIDYLKANELVAKKMPTLF